jgi:hypothetical protein
MLTNMALQREKPLKKDRIIEAKAEKHGKSV